MNASEGERALETHIRQVGLPLPIPEYRFAPPRMWRFDCAWPDLHIAVEVEGGTWVAGAHTRGKHFESDAEKYNEAALRGWMVLRFTTEMVLDGRAIAVIERAHKLVAGGGFLGWVAGLVR